MRNPAESQDDDDEGPIYAPVKLTPYDRRRTELRDLEAKRDAILAQGQISNEDRTCLVTLAPLITKAQARFDREADRAKDDIWRKRRGIDDWRGDAGREEYNATRRTVRLEPNADLSDLTPAQKKQRKLDQTADSKWLKRCRTDGWPEVRIQAAYAVRLRDREAKRAGQDVDDADDAAMRADPNFGMMGSGK